MKCESLISPDNHERCQEEAEYSVHCPEYDNFLFGKAKLNVCKHHKDYYQKLPKCKIRKLKKDE